jgi:hypothetical protein
VGYLRTFFNNFIEVFIIMTIVTALGLGFFLPIYLVLTYNEWYVLWGFLTLPTAIGYISVCLKWITKR